MDKREVANGNLVPTNNGLTSCRQNGRQPCPDQQWTHKLPPKWPATLSRPTMDSQVAAKMAGNLVPQTKQNRNTVALRRGNLTMVGSMNFSPMCREPTVVGDSTLVCGELGRQTSQKLTLSIEDAECSRILSHTSIRHA